MAKGKYKKKKERAFKLLNDSKITSNNENKIIKKVSLINNSLMSKRNTLIYFFICIYCFICLFFRRIKKNIVNINNYNDLINNVDIYFKDRLKIKSILITICFYIVPLIIIGSIYVNFSIFNAWLSGISKEQINNMFKDLYISNDILSYAWYFSTRINMTMNNIIINEIFIKNSNHYIINCAFLIFSVYICYYINCLINRREFYFFGKKTKGLLKLSFIILLLPIYFIILFIIPLLPYFVGGLNKEYITSLFLMHFYYIFLVIIYETLVRNLKIILIFSIFFYFFVYFRLENLWFNIYSYKNLIVILDVLKSILIVSLMCIILKAISNKKGYLILILFCDTSLSIVFNPIKTFDSIMYMGLYIILAYYILYPIKEIKLKLKLKYIRFIKAKENYIIKVRNFLNYRNVKKIKKINDQFLKIFLVFPLIFISITTYSGVNKIFNDPLLCFINRNSEIPIIKNEVKEEKYCERKFSWFYNKK